MDVSFPVDVALFEQTSHTPSLFTLERSMGVDSTRRLRDYCIPVNSYFPTPEMMSRYQKEFARAVRFYPATNQQIAGHVASAFDLQPDSVVMFNGATELLSWLDAILIRGPVVIPIPTFGRWTDVPDSTGKQLIYYERRIENGYDIDTDELIGLVRRSGAQTLVLCNPNNPTGACVGRQRLLELLDRLTDLPLIVVDESFLDFSDLTPHASVAAEAQVRKNVVVMKSLGKNLGMHGVRMGYSVSTPETARRLRSHVPYWNMNAIAEMVLSSLHEYLSDYQASRQAVVRDRYHLESALEQLPDVEVFSSQANFVFCRLPGYADGDYVRRRLLTEHGYLVRHCGNKIGSDRQFFRLVARRQDETLDLARALRGILSDSRTANGTSLETARC